MTFIPVFSPEGTPVALDDTLHYVVMSALQWKDANLQVMEKAAKQRFAVLYNRPLNERFMMETLEQAHIHGAMSAVKLVAVHKNEICLFLSDEVAADTFPAIESLWRPIQDLDLNRRLWIDFDSEQQVYTGRSDYPFWTVVKEILETNTLGIEQYQIPVLHDCAEEIVNGDEPASHQFHADIRRSFTSQSAAPVPPYSLVLGSVASKLGHCSRLMTEYYVRPTHKSPDA